MPVSRSRLKLLTAQNARPAMTTCSAAQTRWTVPSNGQAVIASTTAHQAHDASRAWVECCCSHAMGWRSSRRGVR